MASKKTSEPVSKETMIAQLQENLPELRSYANMLTQLVDNIASTTRTGDIQFSTVTMLSETYETHKGFAEKVRKLRDLSKSRLSARVKEL